jgi:peptidyl-prolyl cis-trans isomerase D
MITWMQRHKKYLIVTIWISTIAFVGAGFVGWGQYSYGDKAGAVAKVGEIEITMGELQKTYSRLYTQYNQMFQGNFDEEKAKSFGLKSQALGQLTDQALVLNLASSYDLRVNDDELLAEIKTQEYFFKDGVFDKETYKQVLSRNNLSIQDYETDVKKQLLIQKTLKLLPVESTPSEDDIFSTLTRIADKINYKVLSDAMVEVGTSDEVIKPFWETMQQNFMTEVSYDVRAIHQEKVTASYDEAKLSEYYNDNKTHFKDAEEKIIPFENAKDAITAELNEKATKNESLKTYIAHKKGKLPEGTQIQTLTISASNNPYNAETLEEISKLSLESPYLKPVLINNEYYTFELIKITPSVAKTYEEARNEVIPLYVSQQKKEKLLALAEKLYVAFEGTTTDFITSKDAAKISDLNLEEANEFLMQLFNQQQKIGYIALNNGKIVLYNILEQKLLDKLDNGQDNSILKIKNAMFNEGLIKALQNKYQTEIFIQGL